MFLKSKGIAFDQERVHTVKGTWTKNQATNQQELTVLELQTDTWHERVEDPGDIAACVAEIDICKELKAPTN